MSAYTVLIAIVCSSKQHKFLVTSQTFNNGDNCLTNETKEKISKNIGSDNLETTNLE